VLLLTVTLSITTVKTSIIVTQQYCLLFWMTLSATCPHSLKGIVFVKSN
jgi:hypothetical protein